MLEVFHVNVPGVARLVQQCCVCCISGRPVLASELDVAGPRQQPPSHVSRAELACGFPRCGVSPFQWLHHRSRQGVCLATGGRRLLIEVAEEHDCTSAPKFVVLEHFLQPHVEARQHVGLDCGNLVQHYAANAMEVAAQKSLEPLQLLRVPRAEVFRLFVFEHRNVPKLEQSGSIYVHGGRAHVGTLHVYSRTHPLRHPIKRFN